MKGIDAFERTPIVLPALYDKKESAYWGGSVSIHSHFTEEEALLISHHVRALESYFKEKAGKTKDVRLPGPPSGSLAAPILSQTLSKLSR